MPIPLLLAGCALLAARSPDPIERALATDPATADAAIAELRAQGPPALARLGEARSRGVRGAPEAAWDHAFDGVAAQRYARASGLYWYTDLAAAEAEARRTGRPILALRLLGALTDVYSCANSRFFRTILYPDTAIAAELREHWVLWWSSERPVPQVTVDFGDGRTWRTTVTGNSVHYVLDAEGNPFDAIPGLYAPAAFLNRLVEARALFDEAVRVDDSGVVIRAWHAAQLRQAIDAIAGTLGAYDAGEWERVGKLLRTPLGGGSASAVDAVPIAMTKAMPEIRVARAVQPSLADQLRTTPVRVATQLADERGWGMLAGRFPVEFSAKSRAIVAAERPDADPDALLAGLARSVARDTAFDELWLHAHVHAWFAEEPPMTFEALNARVYDELFATPATDPWLGLRDPAVYDGLPR